MDSSGYFVHRFKYSACIFHFSGEILDLILTSCKNPVQPVEEEDTEQKNLCRLVCSESFLHQSDQILRKLVSQEMVIAKGITGIFLANYGTQLLFDIKIMY